MFEPRFTASALEDLRSLKRSAQRLVVDSVERQLRFQPTTPARNRKPLRPNDLSAWELRVGMYRVFYDVDPQQRTVRIKAVGWKERDKLVIRGKELTL
jgi:mRNA-degrading endonuclease RelE of RelBE toxin-antitoxin system